MSKRKVPTPFIVNLDYIEEGSSDFQDKVKSRKAKMQQDSVEDGYVYNLENELGNEVEIIIKEVTDKNGDKEFDAVSISMIGPDSETTNVITYFEAVHLGEAILDYLDSVGKQESSVKTAKKYNKPTGDHKSRWSVKYKKKINCSNPKGFSQKQYCKRKKRGGSYKKN